MDAGFLTRRALHSQVLVNFASVAIGSEQKQDQNERQDPYAGMLDQCDSHTPDLNCYDHVRAAISACKNPVCLITSVQKCCAIG
jgi:hypothetical protein